MASADWLANLLSSSGCLDGKSRVRAADHQGAHDPALAQHRYRRTDAGRLGRGCGFAGPLRPSQVGGLERAACGAVRPTRCESRSIGWSGAAPAAPHCCCRRRPGRGTSRACLSYSIMDPPSVPVSRTALPDDGGEDLIEVEAGADHFADLAERFQLGDLALPAGSTSDSRHACRVDLSQHDRTLGGELLQELAFTDIEERASSSVRHREEHADDLVLEDHRAWRRRDPKPSQTLESSFAVPYSAS